MDIVTYDIRDGKETLSELEIRGDRDRAYVTIDSDGNHCNEDSS